MAYDALSTKADTSCLVSRQLTKASIAVPGSIEFQRCEAFPGSEGFSVPGSAWNRTAKEAPPPSSRQSLQIMGFRGRASEPECFTALPIGAALSQPWVAGPPQEIGRGEEVPSRRPAAETEIRRRLVSASATVQVQNDCSARPMRSRF